MRHSRWSRPILAAVLAVGAGAAALALPGVGSAAPGSNPTVQFGNPNAPDADQGCVTGPPAPEQCANAFHKLIPGSTTIGADETVTFDYIGRHQAVVYRPGKGPNDVQPAAATGPVNDHGDEFAFDPTSDSGEFAVTFTEAGRYLVICNIRGHWDDNMWSWVVVR